MISESSGHRRPPTCADVQRSLEHRFDDEPCELPEDAVDRHLVDCPSCAAHEVELHRVRNLVRTLPLNPFPVEALQEVLDRTVDHPGDAHPVGLIRRHAINLALAAMLMLAAVGAWFVTNGLDVESEYSEAELIRLEQDLEQVFALLGGTLQHTEQVTVRDILIQEASPPLRVVPLEPFAP